MIRESAEDWFKVQFAEEFTSKLSAKTGVKNPLTVSDAMPLVMLPEALVTTTV